MMKKRLCMILACLLLGLTACGQEEQTVSGGDPVFSAGGVEIVIHADAAPILEALGEPTSYSETPSCAGEGMDKTYGYGSFYLLTGLGEDGEVVSRLWLADDTVATPEGIRIGSDEEQVEAAYPDAACCEDGSCSTYWIDGATASLAVVLEDGKVTVIEYSAAGQTSCD